MIYSKSVGKFVGKFITPFAMICNFYLDKRPDKYGDVPIIVSVCIKGQRLLSTIGFSISPGKWIQTRQGADNSTIQVQQVKKGCSNAKGISAAVINTRIKQIEAAFEFMANTVVAQPTKNEMQKKLNSIKGKKEAKGRNSATTVIDYYNDFVRAESTENQWAENTRKCYDAFRIHLQEFVKKNGIKSLSSFDSKGKERFVCFLRDDLEMSESTAQKRYAYLKHFLNWCKGEGLYRLSEGAKDNYKPKFNKPDNGLVFLTKQELSVMYDLNIPKNGEKIKVVGIDGEEVEITVSERDALEKTRDCFCFCCFTGLRYSDMSELKRSNVFSDRIEFTTKKTNTHLRIELNSHSRAILDKYANCNFPEGRALPAFTNQASNRYIKILGQLCGLNEMITRSSGIKNEKVTQPKWAWLSTHCGRRSFVCFALASGIAPQVVMKWTGHKNYETMKPYIAVADTTKQQAMRIFEDNFSKEK